MQSKLLSFVPQGPLFTESGIVSGFAHLLPDGLCPICVTAYLTKCAQFARTNAQVDDEASIHDCMQLRCAEHSAPATTDTVQARCNIKTLTELQPRPIALTMRPNPSSEKQTRVTKALPTKVSFLSLASSQSSLSLRKRKPLHFLHAILGCCCRRRSKKTSFHSEQSPQEMVTCPPEL